MALLGYSTTNIVPQMCITCWTSYHEYVKCECILSNKLDPHNGPEEESENKGLEAKEAQFNCVYCTLIIIG